MYCSECGAKLKKNAAFCGECGTKVEKESEEREEKQTPKKTKTVNSKKPISKKKKILIGVIVLVVVALIGGYCFLNNRFGPEGVATEYLEAMISNDAGRIYDSLGLTGDTTFTSEEEFKKVFEKSYNAFDDVLNYKLVNVSYNESKLSANVEFQIASENSEEDTVTIRVIKNSKKKFLIFDSWQVANVSDSLVVKDYQISVPKGSTVQVNEISLDSKYLNSEKSTNELDVYVIPQIFEASASIKINLPYGIEVTDEMDVSSYNTTYEADITLEDLNDETVTKLQDQMKSDINALYANLIAKKDWNAVKESYSYGDASLINLQEEYQDLYEELVSDSDKTLKKFDVTSLTLTKVALDDGKLKVTARYNYTYTIDYKNYNDEVKTKEGKSSSSTTITYDYIENAFKMNNISGTVDYFSTW